MSCFCASLYLLSLFPEKGHLRLSGKKIRKAGKSEENDTVTYPSGNLMI